MIMKKCLCCRSIVEDNSIVCKVCKIPQNIIGDADSQEVQKLIKDYRNNIIGDKVISFKAYVYEDSDVEFQKEPVMKKMKLANVCDLEFDKIYWSDIKFASLEETESIDVCISCNDKDIPLQIKVSKPTKFTAIGVTLAEGLNIRLVVGSKENPIYTSVINI